jgi:hypothetical protein
MSWDRQVTTDTRFNFFHSPLQFGAGEIAVAIVSRASTKDMAHAFTAEESHAYPC